MFEQLSLKKISQKVSLEAFGLWWRRRSSIFFSLLFFVVLGFGIFSWYQSLYLFHWTGDEEKEYRLSKSKQIKFQQEKFDATLNALDVRAEKHRQVPGSFRDIFFGE